MDKRLASLLLLATVVSGCGASPAALPKASIKASSVGAQSQPGWGKKTWATMVVPQDVMGYVSQEAAKIEAQYQKEYGNQRDFRLNWQMGLVLSRDGFKTIYRGGIPGLKPPETPQSLEFTLGQVPAGEYQYYMTVSANLVEYSGGSFRQIWKTYGPVYVSNYGRNFAGQVVY